MKDLVIVLLYFILFRQNVYLESFIKMTEQVDGNHHAFNLTLKGSKL